MKQRYKELDSLRGIAALLVVLFHYTLGRKEALFGFKLGTTGVDLFFIISGFVILMSLMNVQNYKQFIANRISRIYPTYWASVSFTFLLLIFYGLIKNDFGFVSIKQFLGNLTMFQFYLKIPNLDGPYWTMIIEMLFYIIMVILFHLNFLKYLDIIFISLSILTVISTNFYFDNIWVQRFFYFIPFIQFSPLFYAGTIFYRITLNSNKNLNIKFYLILLFCLISQILLFNYSGRARRHINYFEYAIMLSIYFTVFTLFVNNQLKFIINKPSLFLGKISFALYLIHQKFSIFIIIPFLLNNLKFNFWLASFIALFCSISMATIITYLVEIPYSKKMKEKIYLVFRINNEKENTKFQSVSLKE